MLAFYYSLIHMFHTMYIINSYGVWTLLVIFWVLHGDNQGWNRYVYRDFLFVFYILRYQISSQNMSKSKFIVFWVGMQRQSNRTLQ